jgi:hypothetical protein
MATFFAGVYLDAYRFGRTFAMLRFTFGIGFDISFASATKAVREARKAREISTEPYLDRKEIIDFFLKQELLPVTNYLPDVKMLRKNGVKIYMAAGKRSLEKKRFYAQTAPILAEQLGCELVVFPGHHASFVDQPHEWAQKLRETLQNSKE